MLIKEDALKHWIDNFYGYGSWQARFWFINHEEGGGDTPEEVADKLNYFRNLHAPDNHTALCDIRELYQYLHSLTGPAHEPICSQIFTNIDLIGTWFNMERWKNLIAFVHGYQNKPLPDLLEYQKNYLD
ncbi:MAG: hypothetical protein U5K54_09420 [Cytophagales bacterium]|nr:hypothetical protein [Cytophagales bacterium]